MFHVDNVSRETFFMKGSENVANMISNISLCNVPITPTHQIDFNSLAEQEQYFAGKTVHSFYPCKYQPRSGTIKIKGYVDTFNNCNYGYYTNEYNGTSKRFYFWIVQKRALARETTELTIHLDVFQTWLFDYSMPACFIERQHVNDDTKGKHTYPENFELGDYVYGGADFVESMQSNPCYFVAVTDSDSGNIGGLYGRTYSGFTLRYYAYEDRDELSEYITELCNDGKADAIAFIFTFPNEFITNASELSYETGDFIGGIEGTLEEVKEITTIVDYFSSNGDTYIPKNNKLYNYPYNFLTVRNSAGSNVVLKFENFANRNSIKFLIETVLCQNPIFTCTPKDYNRTTLAYEDSISEQGFGLCSWNNDNYANWYAQNQNSIRSQSNNAIMSYNGNNITARNNYNTARANNTDRAWQGGINAGLDLAKGLGRFDVIGGLADATAGVNNTSTDYFVTERNARNDLSNQHLMNDINYQNTIRSLMASVQDAQVQPNTAKGDTSICGLDLARKTVTFRFQQTTIKPEYARKIDMYFQMYGYQVNTVEVPNIKTRERWNYIKTVNAVALGSIPYEDRQSIADLYNNGFTVWHNESYMYSYNVKNAIK